MVCKREKQIKAGYHLFQKNQKLKKKTKYAIETPFSVREEERREGGEGRKKRGGRKKKKKREKMGSGGPFPQAPGGARPFFPFFSFSSFLLFSFFLPPLLSFLLRAQKKEFL